MFPKSSRFLNVVLMSAFITSLVMLVSCKKDDPKSNLAGLTAFSIKDLNVNFTIDEVQRIIQNADSLPFQTDVSSLVANFTAVPLSTVKVGGTVQVSGTTANNFNDPVQYDVVAQDGVTTRTYTVRVNVAKLDPETVAWNQVTAAASWGPFRTTTAGFYNGKLWVIGAQSGSFGAFTRGIFNSADGATWTAVTGKDDQNNDVPYAQRQKGVFGFQNKMWLLGGLIPDIGFNFSKVTNQVWSSTDGISWTLKTPLETDTWWSARERINAVVFNNKLFIVGGNAYPSFGNADAPGVAYNDVWSSADGNSWTKLTDAASFLPRTNPAVFVYNNKIWVAGGRDNGGNLLNDIWNSSDGATWTQVTATTPFTPRWGHQVVVYKDQLFLVGGETSDTETSNELWISEDGGGKVWNKVTSPDVRALPANFPPHTLFSFFNNDNTLWIIGGQGAKVDLNRTYVNDVWKGAFPQ